MDDRANVDGFQKIGYAAAAFEAPVGGSHPVDVGPSLVSDTRTASQWLALSQGGLLVTLWLVTRPYRGITHDARLYAAQALNRLTSQSLQQDVYFRFGSQDSFSAFSLIYAPVVSALGPGLAHALFAALGQALWVAALVWLMRTLFGPGRAMIAAAGAVIVLNPLYGGDLIFRYGEGFATPRLFAEALVLVAVALALRRRFLPMFGALGLAVVLHPLMALTGIAVITLFATFHDRRAWLVIAGGLAVGASLAVAGVEPFVRIRSTFSPTWFQVVYDLCNYAFVSRWRWFDFVRLVSCASVLLAAVPYMTRTERRLGAAAALAAVFGVGVTLVGADIGHSVLVVNVQAWRTLWFACLLANAYAAIVLLRTAKGSLAREVLVAAFVSAAAASLTATSDIVSPLALLIAAGLHLLERRQGRTASGLPRILGLVVGAALLVFAITVVIVVKQANPAHVGRELIATAVGAASVALLIWSLRHTPGRKMAIASVALAVTAFSVLDRRDDWAKFVETEGVPSDLAAFAGTNAIYWESGIEVQWLKLRQPSYYSCLQRTGVMFYVETALEYQRRSFGLSALRTADFTTRETGYCAKTTGTASLGADELAKTCRMLPDLDTLVLTHELPGVSVHTWRPPVPATVRDEQSGVRYVSQFYRYSCSDFR